MNPLLAMLAGIALSQPRRPMVLFLPTAAEVNRATYQKGRSHGARTPKKDRNLKGTSR
jgi:hypothetical protein